MEIFIRDIHYSVNELDLSLCIGKILERIEGIMPKFDVRRHFNRRRFGGMQGNVRTGSLTVLSRELGEKFLHNYGGRSPRIPTILANRRLTFLVSRFPPKPDVLERLRRVVTPDIRSLEASAHRTRTLEGGVPLKVIQFGWECRDNVFSSEWEMSSATCSVGFFTGRRSFYLCINGAERDEFVIMRFSQLNYITASTQNTSVFLSLSAPPSYESGHLNPSSTFDMVGTDLRTKMTSLGDSDHQRKAPFISFAIRFAFSDHQHLTRFRELCVIAHMRKLDDHTKLVVDRQLFSIDNIDAVESWLRLLPWEAAFEISSWLRECLCDPRELLQLQPRIDNILRDQGTSRTVALLRHFHIDLRNLLSMEDDTQDLGHV